MDKVSIIDFIKSGQFGHVEPGMNDTEVVKILGKPEERYDSEDAFLFYYGRWEIHFLRDNFNKVFLIQNDHLLYDCTNHNEMIEFKNSTFQIDLNFIEPFKHVRLKEVIKLIENEKIEFTFVDEDHEPMLKTESGVYMNFTNIEPIIPKDNGFDWGPGKHKSIQAKETKIKDSKDFILYSIGISNLIDVMADKT